MTQKLSQRKAETVAAFLRNEKNIKIAIPHLRDRTPVEVAKLALGSVPQKQITKLAEEICERVGFPIAEAA